MWYDIADESGLLIQNEFFLWTEKNYWSVPELETQVSQWMRDLWNHPCVVIWDMQNETRSDRLGDIINRHRPLDLSNRQWENGWSKPAGENDRLRSQLSQLYRQTGRKNFSLENARLYILQRGNRNELFQPYFTCRHPDEYGWLWLRRNGDPTILSKGFYSGMVPDYTAQQRMDIYVLIAGETEYLGLTGIMQE